MRICFVALEILGPFSGGGIATALAGQAEHHAKDHDVTVLYVHPGLDEADAAQWVEYYAGKGIRFVRAAFRTYYPRDNLPKRSFAVMQYLEAWDEDFDVIYFHDYLGLGYYTCLARRLGLAFQNTLIGTVLHGPSDWARSLNLVRIVADDVTLYEMERKQTEYSDFAIGPSAHILDWCREQGWALPTDTRAVSNLLPRRLDLHTGLAQGAVVTGIREVVYFGRLEIRKGLFAFLDALTYMRRHGLGLPQRITFLGAFCANSGRHAASTILDYAENWDCEVRFLNGYDHEAAIRYLVANRPLTVVPSLDESFGLTAFECLSFGVPALISDRGALVGLPAEPEREAILVPPRPNLLGQRIAACLRDGAVVGAVDPAHHTADQAWTTLLDDLAARPPAVDPWGATVSVAADAPPPKPDSAVAEPLVSVILVHYNRPSTFRTAFASVLAQTYRNIEIIVVDDGSPAGAFDALQDIVTAAEDPRVRLLRQENRYLGAARNHGVAEAQGEYLLFMDDDNVAMADEIATFVQVAVATGADVLNTVSRLFRTEGEARVPYDLYLPVGPSLPLALFGNTFGDANALVRAETFRALGGFTEEYAQGAEDYEFFTRAYLSGARMQLVPREIFDYRAEHNSMMKELNSEKYIVNQRRGVRALFESHRDIDLATMRGVMQVAFFGAIAEEQGYWQQHKTRQYKHPELEGELARHIQNPNGPEACAVVAKLLTAYGRIREALAFLERNQIDPDDGTLAQLHALLLRFERRQVVSGQVQNALVNGAFDFWSLGTRHAGIDPYQYVANDWVVPSSKRRQSMTIQQESDAGLLRLSRARSANYMRINLTDPDPGGYCFLSQRIADAAPLLENEVELSGLLRSTPTGPLNMFLRVTYEHGTENFADIWPAQPAWLAEHWQRVDLRFDLTDQRLEALGQISFLSLFLKVRTDQKLVLDIADMALTPHGSKTHPEPYIRENERIRAERQMFPVGQGARAAPGSAGDLRLTLPTEVAARINERGLCHVRSSLVLSHDDGTVRSYDVLSAFWRNHPSDPDGPYLRVEIDGEMAQPGTVLEHFAVMTIYRTH